MISGTTNEGIYNPYPSYPCPVCNEDPAFGVCDTCGSNFQCPIPHEGDSCLGTSGNEVENPLAALLDMDIDDSDTVQGDIDREKIRQWSLKQQGKFPHILSDPDCPDLTRILVLTEEVGEVARAMQDNPDDTTHLYEELVQVAAVTQAWLEYLRGSR